MFSTVTVPRELNPLPVIVIISFTEATAGVITIDGLGVENAVEVLVTLPTLIEMICVPGDNEPPNQNAGTSTTHANAPAESVRIPPLGIAFEPPIVRVDAVVLGGNPEPTSVIKLPVETLTGLAVITPS